MVVSLLSYKLGREVITMETFLEFLREILKGIVRESGAYFFRKNVLEHEKTTPRRRKLKGGSHKK
jgi:CRISPR/Cas system CSM-associated protein Csm2 small subunit